MDDSRKQEAPAGTIDLHRLRSLVLSRNERIVAFAIIAYTVTLTVLTYFKYLCFRTLAFDMGIFIQLFWNTLHGSPFFTQPRGSLIHPTSFFAVHFSPLLILLLPLYQLFPNPFFLFLLQSAALAAPAYLIFLISRKVGNEESVSLLLSLIYLIYPGTLWSNWYDFHLESFIPLGLSLTYYYYFKNRRSGLFFSMMLLLAVFERSAVISIATICYFLIRDIDSKRKKAGFFQNKVSYTVLGLVFLISVGYIFIAEHYMNTLWPQREVLQPLKILGKVSYTSLLLKVAYLTLLAAPLAFLQFNALLELMPAGPYLLLAALTDYSPYYHITWQYPAVVSVPFFVSAAVAARSVTDPNLKPKLLGLSLAAFLLFAPGTPLMSRFSSTWAIMVPGEENYMKNQALSLIEPNATVLAQENIFPNVAQRETVYSQWPPGEPPPDYIVFDVTEYWFYYEPNDVPLNDHLKNLLQETSYGVWANIDGFMILKHGYTGEPVASTRFTYSLDFASTRDNFISFEDSFLKPGYFIPYWVDVRQDSVHVQPSYNTSIWWGPYLTLPPGDYMVTINGTADTLPQDTFLTLEVLSYETGLYNQYTLNGVPEPGAQWSMSFSFTTDTWNTDVEVIGRNHGNADFHVTSLRLVGQVG